MQKIFFDNELLNIIGRVADEVDINAYAVGGYVRDYLLGKECKDIDIVVIGNGPKFAKKVAVHLGATNLSVYRRFGTAMIRQNDFVLEFVGARKESYDKSSRKPAVEEADLETDLTRRDFTINALAVSLNKRTFGQLVDPFGGKKDLANKIIRTPLGPAKTFYDDPLRIMRAIRFAAQLHFHLDPETEKGIAEEKERLAIISQERITDELTKILASEKPSIGFHLMEKSGILKVILPEIDALHGVDQVGKHHHKDVFLHTIKVIDNIVKLSDRLRLRWAALFHDVAKPETKEYKKGVGWTFHGHDELGARMIGGIGKRLRLSNDLVKYLEKMIRLHLRPISLVEQGVTDSAIRRLILQAGDELDDLMILCRADITSGNPKRAASHLANFDWLVERIQEVEEKDHLRQFQAPVRGDEIMKTLNLTPGPLVGKIKKMIEEAILNGDIPNEHQAAFEYMLKIKDQVLGK